MWMNKLMPFIYSYHLPMLIIVLNNCFHTQKGVSIILSSLIQLIPNISFHLKMPTNPDEFTSSRKPLFFVLF